MKIGFGKVDITPPLGTYLCGQLAPMKAEGVESRLYATAMCLDDGKTAVVFCSCDVVALTNGFIEEVSRQSRAALGPASPEIIVTTTHTHSGPNTIDLFGKDANGEYIDALRQGIVKALTRAYETRRDGCLAVGHGELAGFAFNRRFVMSDGTVQTHPLKGNPHLVESEGPDSSRLDVFLAKDDQDRPIGAAVVFGCHATVMERDNRLISSDFPGKAAIALAEKLGGGAEVLFFQGACGNICQVDPRDVGRREVGLEWSRTMGAAVAERAHALTDGNCTQAVGPIRVLTQTVTIPRRPVPAELTAWAHRPREAAAETPVLSNYGVEMYGQVRPPAVCLEDLFETPFWANFYAQEIKTLEQARGREPRLTLPIKVVAQDNWAMVALPCELFVEWGEAIRGRSPFEHTAVVELANGWNGYIPTRKAFERAGGYETKSLTSTLLVPEAGEMVLQTVLEMLEKAKKNSGF